MNKIFFTFGNWRYSESVDALCEQAKLYTDTVYGYREGDIPSWFYRKNKNLFKDNRGFGYWVWKAFFIKELLNNAKEDDVFMYADAGNAIIQDIAPLFNICKNDEKGIILYDNSDGNMDHRNHKNAHWTKSDCFNLLGLAEQKYLQGNQVNASYLTFRKNDFSVKFFDVFLQACENYNIISDAPNITENFNKDFIDHRHDQSVLSLLSIRYNITVKRDPSQWGMGRYNINSEYPQLFNHHRKNILNS